MILLIIALSILSAICGRAGGIGASDKSWIPQWMRHTWVRDWICPLFALFPLVIINPSLWFIPAYGMMGGMLTTYWDWLFGFDNFWFSGFMTGLAGMFLIGAGFLWWFLLIRAFVIAILWGLINFIANKNKFPDGLEEYLRYGCLPVTSLIVMI